MGQTVRKHGGIEQADFELVFYLLTTNSEITKQYSEFLKRLKIIVQTRLRT